MAETEPTDRSAFHARPTLRVAGREEPRASELVVGMEMREHEGGMSHIELRFSNVASTAGGAGELAFEDERVLRLGAELRVYCGDIRSPHELFRGVVTAVELRAARGMAPELVVLAEDALQRARLARRTRVVEHATIRGIAEEVASAAGLRAVVTAFDDDIGTHVQLGESDLAFLRRLVAERDGDVQVVEDELHVSPRADVDRGELELALLGKISELRVIADLSGQSTSVSVTGWDAERSRRVRIESRGARLGPGEGRTGAELLRDALGERAEHVGHVAVRDEDEARALADAAFDQAARRFVVAHGVAEGNATLRVGSRLRLTRVSRRFDNTFYVTSTCHRFDLSRGYETEFEAECAYLGAP